MKNQREIKKKDPEFYRKLLALLIPMVVQNLMNALVSASDALMVGTLDQRIPCLQFRLPHRFLLS